MFEAERLGKLAELLRKTSDSHAEAFAATGGADADWPHWFGDRLAEPLGELLGRSVEPGTLATLLEEAEQEHLMTSPGREWPAYYAEFLVSRVMRADL